jgi:uncharacterized repeat protein (TIGR03803 family)
MRQLSILRIALLFAVATTVHAQTYKVLYNFGSQSGDPTGPRYSGIIAQSRGGYLFSTADSHWTDYVGRAFKITTGGHLTVLHSFSGPDGQGPVAGLTLATDGQYYGTTQSGGTYGNGTIFKMTQDGTITTLYSFQGGADGAAPQAPPIESEAGQFYGTTAGQEGGNTGSVYRITRYGDFTLLHTFTGADGANPYGPLVQGTDYYFYGTTHNGGTHGDGTIFRVSRSGDFKVLFNFDGSHGIHPGTGLIQANDGNYYGVTTYGGSLGGGTVYKMTPGYVVTVLHNINGSNEGSNQAGGLMQATDGNLYGTNNLGGAHGWGVLFRITLGGDFTVLHDFDWNTGASPQDTILQHTNGILYATTTVGGSNNGGDGTFYSFDVGLKPFVTYLPTYGRVGALVQILGQGFTSDSTVSFNGVPASFTAVYPTYIRAFVPGGATSGPITVTTPTGTLTSNKIFLVRP